MSFRLRVVTTIIMLTTFIMFLILWVTLGFLENKLTSEIKNSNINTIEQLKSYSVMNAVITDEYGRLQYDFESITKNNSLDEILLIDKSNIVVASSDLKKIGSVFNRDEFDEHWEVDRIEIGSAYAGILVYCFNDDALALAKRETLSFGLMLIVLGVILMAVVGYFAGVWLTRRLEKMVDSLDIITSGQIEKFTVDESADEVGMLSRFVHQIGQKIASQKEELLNSEDRMRMALQSAGAGLWTYDLKTKKLTWTAKSYHIFGVLPSAKEPSIDLWLAYIHPEDRQGVLDQLTTLFEKKKDLSVEYRIIRSSGEVRWLKSVGRFFVDVNGKAVEAYGMLFDISEQKRDRMLLEKERDLLAAMTDASHNGWLVTNGRDEIVFHNKKAKKIFNIPDFDKVLPLASIFSQETIVTIKSGKQERFVISLIDNTEISCRVSAEIVPYQDADLTEHSIINFHFFEEI